MKETEIMELEQRFEPVSVTVSGCKVNICS